MNLLLNNIENLDHRNVYMIKRMIGSLLTEFEKAVSKKNKQRAHLMRELTSKVYDKIKSNFLWSRRVDKVLTEMAKKLNK